MKKAIYTNKITKETYVIVNVSGIGQASNLINFVLGRTGWQWFDVSFKVVDC